MDEHQLVVVDDKEPVVVHDLTVDSFVDEFPVVIIVVDSGVEQQVHNIGPHLDASKHSLKLFFISNLLNYSQFSIGLIKALEKNLQLFK